MRIWSQNWVKLSQRWASLILLSAMSNSMGSVVVLFLQEICFYRRIFTFSYLFTWALLCSLRNTITEGSKESEIYSRELSYFHFHPALCLPWYFVNLEEFQEHSKFWEDVWKPWDNREKDVIKCGAATNCIYLSLKAPLWVWWQMESPRQIELGGDAPENKPVDEWGWGASLLHSQRQGKETPPGKDGIFPCVVPQ